jgi:hypothetical protein
VLLPQHYKIIQAEFAKEARSVLMGDACEKPGADNSLSHPVSRSKVEVLALFDIAPIAVECATMRLKWLSQIIRCPENHRLYIAAMFGKLDVGEFDCSQFCSSSSPTIQ